MTTMEIGLILYFGVSILNALVSSLPKPGTRITAYEIFYRFCCAVASIATESVNRFQYGEHPTAAALVADVESTTKATVATVATTTSEGDK